MGLTTPSLSIIVITMSKQTLVALSGGVDSSTAAALVLADGPTEATGVTLGLWGGERESNSCSTADATAARHVATQLGIGHEYLDWTSDFDAEVVGGFVDYAKAGKTANPCISCNKTFKADRLFAWAEASGFDCVVTGHYARVVATVDGPRVARAVDVDKDQSYVLCGFRPDQIARMRLPLGALTKSQVREYAHQFGLDVADKAESMGLCFSPKKVLAAASLGSVAVVDSRNEQPVGEVPVGLASVGQRKGLGVNGQATAKYVIDIRADAVVIGTKEELRRDRTPITNWSWVGSEPDAALLFQTSAHGAALPGRFVDGAVVWDTPHVRVAPGQIVVAYTNYVVDGEKMECVVGWGEAN
jgi:tRNA-uridine 2-sulfurtransferase